jgi:hypothetical protein
LSGRLPASRTALPTRARHGSCCLSALRRSRLRVSRSTALTMPGSCRRVAPPGATRPPRTYVNARNAETGLPTLSPRSGFSLEAVTMDPAVHVCIVEAIPSPPTHELTLKHLEQACREMSERFGFRDDLLAAYELIRKAHIERETKLAHVSLAIQCERFIRV